MTELEIEHTTMVSNLIKDPQVIANLMSAHGAALLHAAVGISGEVGELMAADVVELKDATGSRYWMDESSDIANVLEEAGDTLFYIRDLRTTTGRKAVAMQPAPFDAVPWDTITRTASIAAARLLDIVKKVAIAGQSYDSTVADRIAKELDTITLCVCGMLERCKFTYDDALAHNMNKLVNGSKPRYPGGVYTDAAAAARADKVGTHEEIAEVPALAKDQTDALTNYARVQRYDVRVHRTSTRDAGVEVYAASEDDARDKATEIASNSIDFNNDAREVEASYEVALIQAAPPASATWVPGVDLGRVNLTLPTTPPPPADYEDYGIRVEFDYYGEESPRLQVLVYDFAVDEPQVSVRFGTDGRVCEVWLADAQRVLVYRNSKSPCDAKLYQMRPEAFYQINSGSSPWEIERNGEPQS